MWLIVGAMRRPITLMILLAAAMLMAVLALTRMKVDIFPDMKLPMVSVIQPYGGMTPEQMEGYLTTFYEQHFFYISGVDHVSSQSIASSAVINVYFRPETNMADAMSQVVAQVERSRAYMPPGTVNPFVLRFDVGDVAVGFIVFRAENRPLGEIQDLVYSRVRPVVATIPGVTTPPPFGANQRTVVISVDREKLEQYNMSPQDIAQAIATGNAITPSGLVRIGDKELITSVNSVVTHIQSLGNIVLKHGGTSPEAVYLRDVATISDSTDIPTGYALVDNTRTIFMAISKQSSASTLAVVDAVKAKIPYMESLLPPDIKVSFQFDQSVYVTQAVHGLAFEAGLGAVLTGLMVLLFLGDLRSSLIVVLNIPMAVLFAVLALFASGQTINIMTLSGLALAVGILVDEATVTIENIHAHRQIGKPIIEAVFDATSEVAVPRLLAMLSVVSVFMPSLFMQGTIQSLFVPLSLAVGFAMIASYFLSSMFVPVMSCWLLKRQSEHPASHHPAKKSLMERVRARYTRLLDRAFDLRLPVLCGYAVVIVIGFAIYPFLGREMFPTGNPSSFQLRISAPAGTRFEETEQICKNVINTITNAVGDKNVEVSIAYAGTQPPSYAISQVYMWTAGPQEAIVLVSLKPSAGINVHDMQEALRKTFAKDYPGIDFSFEAGDIVNKIMNFGTPTPIQVDVSGPDFSADADYGRKLLAELKRSPDLRDARIVEPLDYPAITATIDRKRAGELNLTAKDVGLGLADATYSSRFTSMVFWRDPRSGLAYQVQMQVPPPEMRSLADVGAIPLEPQSANGATDASQYSSYVAGPFLRDVASLQTGTTAGEYDHYNMQRTLSITANLAGHDLGRGARVVRAAIDRLQPALPRGVTVTLRGQPPIMDETFASLAAGVIFAALAIFIMLVAYFQSFLLALAIMSVIPGVVFGALAITFATGTTLNIQSFMGTIMATGVGVANSILVVVFCEERRLTGDRIRKAAIDGASHRLRPVLMTSLAMIAGMIPMALGLSEGGDRTSPLGRAVIGGLVASTATVLLILPLVYSVLRARAVARGPDLLAKANITPGSRDRQTPATRE